MKGEVVLVGEESVILHHARDDYGTTWSCLDGTHPRENVVFYKEKTHENQENSEQYQKAAAEKGSNQT